jgi:type IV pilus assembly protein PilP
MSRAALALVFAALLLAGCGGEEFGDLKAELNEKSKDFRGRVEPLPQVKPYEPVPYTAEQLVDPFRPDRIDVAGGPRAARADAGKMAPDLNRPKEPLEAFPIESLQMMGTITQNRDTFALVKAGPNLYRVRKGNYMGLNFGVVTSIDEAEVKLKELVQDGTGEWVERTTALQLLETKK